MLSRRSVLISSAGVEAATGLALIIVPTFVGRLLLGGITGAGLAVAALWPAAAIHAVVASLLARPAAAAIDPS